LDDIERWRALGADIRRRREQLGWNQGRLGQEAGGWKQGVVSDDERGPRNGIPPTRLRAYADALAETNDEPDSLLLLWLRMTYGPTGSPADSDEEGVRRQA
jgi:hypothetical protein